LIDTTVPYKIIAELEDWPTDSNPDAPILEQEKDVNYVSACPNPDTFSANTQNYPPASDFDNIEKTITFVPHTMEPDYCSVDYTCENVGGPNKLDGSANTFTCEDLTIDLVCDEVDASDCTIKFTPDPTGYINGDTPPGTYPVEIKGCNPAAVVE